MPQDEEAISAWGAAQKDLRNFRVERPAEGRQLVLRYERPRNLGPADPDWRSLGYSMPYLVSTQSSDESKGLSKSSEFPAYLWGSILAGSLAMGLVAAFRIRSASRSGVPLIRLRDGPTPGWWKWLLAACAVVALINLVLRLFHIQPEINWLSRGMAMARGWRLASAFAVVVLAAPLAEELFFRGLIAGRFMAYGHWRLGLVLSAVLFAFAHGTTTDMPALFGFGLVAAWLYRRTGSLWPSITLHSLNNAVALTAAVLDWKCSAPHRPHSRGSWVGRMGGSWKSYHKDKGAESQGRPLHLLKGDAIKCTFRYP